MQASTPLARFGKYEVIGLLGRGGMAEVYLCRLSGLGGFNKDVVVKRILPHHLGDPGFLQMFIEEARLAANLNHPNVVQVFEIDEANGVPYMAMEYVRGPTLATVIGEARSQGAVHLGHFAKIISGVCAGLHHAHTASGPDGERLGIIHRDVSPQNILISPDGVPKILDFGIAKAHGRSVATEAGTLKGKLRYMAPERLQHEEVDARADVFSAGVVLFEATTGRVPFGSAGSSSEFDLISNLLSGRCTRPSQIVAGYPEELEKLVLWAMAHRVADRCPTAHHLHQALEAFVSKGEHASNTHDLAQWMHALVPSRLFSTPTGEAARRARAGLPNNSITPDGPLAISSRVPQLDLAEARPATQAPAAELAAAQAIPVVASSSLKRKLFAVVAMVAVCAALALWGSRKGEPAPATQVSTPSALKPDTEAAFSPHDAARAYLDEIDRLMEGRRYGPAEQLLAKARELKIVDPTLTIRLVRAEDGLRVQLALREAREFLAQKHYGPAIEAAKNVLDRDPENEEAMQLIAASRAARDPVDSSVRANRSPRRERAGVLQIVANVSGMAYLNDDPLGRTPIRDKEVPAGEYTLQIRAQGYQPYETRIRVAPGKPLSVDATLAMEVAAQRVESAPQASPPPAEPPPAVSAAPSWRPVPAPTSAESVVASEPRLASATEHPRELTTSAGTAVGTSAAVTAAPVAVPAQSGSDKTVSARPNDRIPSPALPREYDAKDAADLQRACRIIEKQVTVLAGVSPEFATGVTSALQRLIGGGGGRLYPVAMYYLIVIEAGRGHDKKTAGQALVAMHNDSGLRDRMGALPARQAKR